MLRSFVLDPEGVGQFSPGQRPGLRDILEWHPEGVRYAGVSQAFSLEDTYDREPRALPWAKLSDPFGVKTNSGQLDHFNATPLWERAKTNLTTSRSVHF